MATMNISLLDEQTQFIDHIINKHGFANRSEFFRSLLRLVKSNPQLITQAETIPFVSPKQKSVHTIVKNFKTTQKYSAEFLKDLEEGLKESNYFSE